MLSLVEFLYAAPVWLMATIVAGFAVGMTIVALLLVNRLWARDFRRAHNDITGFLIAVVGLVYAILVSTLAVTVLEQRDEAEAIVVREADIVANLHRALGTLAEGTCSELHASLATYVTHVIDREWP